MSRKMDINKARYILEHETLPNWVLRQRGPFIQTLTESKGMILYNMLLELCKNEQIDMPYLPELFSATVGKLEDGFFAMIIGFPQPHAIPLCYRIILIFDNACTDIGFYTIELGEESKTCMGEYRLDENDKLVYIPHGDSPKTYDEELNKAIMLYLQKDNDIEIRVR